MDGWIIIRLQLLEKKNINWNYHNLNKKQPPSGKLMQHLRFWVSCFLVILPRNNFKKRVDQDKAEWCSLHLAGYEKLSLMAVLNV